MQAKDVMTASVMTASPQSSVRDIARLFIAHRISAVPVVDEVGRLVGIVSEGDLINRPDAGTRHRSSWWLEIIAGPDARASEYLRAHGQVAADVMTRDVVSVDEDTPLGAIAAILEKCRIKRVPVLREGKLVGIVSRANLLHGIVAQSASPAIPTSERETREAIRDEIVEAGVSAEQVNVVVTERAVQLWGWADSETQQRAVGAAAQARAGTRRVENNVAVMPAQVKSQFGGV